MADGMLINRSWVWLEHFTRLRRWILGFWVGPWMIEIHLTRSGWRRPRPFYHSEQRTGEHDGS